MQFQNQVRNNWYKCDSPDHTLKRIKQGLKDLDLDPQYSEVQVTDFLFWGRVRIDSLQITCEGKGITKELAEASAYAELAERLSAGLYYPVFEEQVRFHLPALYSPDINSFLNYGWMDGYVWAHQRELTKPLTVESLLRKQTELRPNDLEEIKDCEMTRHWVDGYSLLQDETIKVPIKFVAYIHGTNGMAAGNTIEEAMIQAACEIFERYTQINVIKPEKEIPSIDLDSIDTPLIRKMIDFYNQNKVRVTIKDPSFNGHLPVIGVLFTNQNLPSNYLEYRTFIPGASFNLEEALTRCFTEGMQGKHTLLFSRPQLNRTIVPGSHVNNYYLLMKHGVSPKDISFLERGKNIKFQSSKKKDILEEIKSLKDICKGLHTDCILLNHTHPILKFPVVRLVIPGISDFLPFLPPDILTNERTKPSTAWKGEEFKRIMQSFFA